MSIFVNICALLACFMFAASNAGAAGKAFEEKNWGSFGFSITLTFSFWLGIVIILQMWFGV